MAVAAIGTVGLGRPVKRLAVGKDIRFGELVKSLDRQLDDEHQQEDGGHQLVAAALAQIRKADGDNQERLESFAERDDKRLEHPCNPIKMRSDLRMTGQFTSAYPTGQVGNA